MKISDVQKHDTSAAKNIDDWLDSFSNGVFQKDGSKVKDVDGLRMPDYGIRSLKNFPPVILGNCDLARNLIKNLIGGPKKVDGFFSLTSGMNSQLTSLEGFPEEVNGTIDISYNNKLTSMVGLPEELVGTLDAYSCGLTSLKGCPKRMPKGVLNVSANKIKSIEGLPEIAFGIRLSSNPIKSLEGIHKIVKQCREITLTACPIESNILGLLLIDKLERIPMTGMGVDVKKAFEILNSYLPNKRGDKAVIECQSELLDAGLDDFAQL